MNKRDHDTKKASGRSKAKKPVWSQQANTSGSVLEVSVWLNEVKLDNDDTIEVHAVSLKRSYKRDGEWETPDKLSLRQQDLLAAAHLLQKAYEFCQEDE